VDTEGYVNIHSASSGIRTFIDSNITYGHVYYYRVGVFDPSTNTTVYSNEVYYSTNSPTLTAPDSLDLTAYSATQIDLRWTYPIQTNYYTKIERRTDDTGWVTVANAAAGVTKYSDTNLTPGTKYYYRITATSDSLVVSLPYPSDATGKWVYTKTSKPASISAVYINSPSQVLLNWYFITNTSTNNNTNNSNDIRSFTIERKSGNEDFKSIGTASSSTPYWTDTTVSQNTRYVYRVKALTDNSSSDYSDEAVIFTAVLNPPSDLTAVSISERKIKLTWVDNSSNETGFELWRRSGSGDSWEKLAVVLSGITSYTDESITTGVQYYYKVRGVFYDNIYSTYSNEAGIQTAQLNAPSNLQYSVSSPSEILLTWVDNSSNESGFKVERKTGIEGDWTDVATLSENTTSFSDTGLTEFTQYYYRVKAYNTTYSSVSYSNITDVVLGVPKAPSDLASQTLSSSRIKLSWTDNSGNELGFRIERSKSGDYFSQVAQVDVNITEYTDTGLEPGTQYIYRVNSYNRSGVSENTGTVYAVTSPSKTFNDIQNIPWAKNAIEDLASRGAISVNSYGSFLPDAILTRAEFVSLVVKSFKLDRITVGGFADVSFKYWAYREIMIARLYGIISGDSYNRFYPDSPISREDMSVIITKTLKVVEKPLPAYDVSILNKYADSGEISSYALSSLASLNGENILNGTTINSISPKDPVTRAEAAVIIYRVIDR